MSDEVVIRVEGLGKRYRIQHQQEGRRYVALRDVIAQKLAAPFKFLRRSKLEDRSSAPSPNSHLPSPRTSKVEDFWALRDVSFSVRQGEVVGIIGRNGAGKSTLLKILSRITEPTEGRVEINGRVASLLEVGTGFHPELTGRENIFLNGAILGMHRAEIKRKFDEIVAFAEVEKFLDTPVKRYSSGMYVRLAFAVAAHLEPEILIVDEVLAVGDLGFQNKCLGKMDDVAKKQGRTVILVSHNMQTVRQLCGRAILLAAGRTVLEGESNHVVQRYLNDVSCGDSLEALARVIAKLPEDAAFKLLAVDVLQDGQSSTSVVTGKEIEIVIQYEVLQTAPGLHVCIVLFDVDGTLLFESLHNGESFDMPVVLPGRYVSQATIAADFLANRTYNLQIYAAIHCVRECVAKSAGVNIRLEVTDLGRVNRGYPGYTTPGKIAPLIPWRTSPNKQTKS